MNIYEKVLGFIFNQKFLYEDLKKLHQAPHHQENFIFSVFDYKQNKVKEIIKYLKVHNDIFLKKHLATYMSENITDHIADQNSLGFFIHPVIIPVPISKKRLRERGFNQTHVLAKYFAKNINGIYKKNIVRKNKITKKQALIQNRYDRFDNVKNAFNIKEDKKQFLKNKDVIIIDDLSTTGATLLEVKKILIKSGTRNIIAVTIAH